MDVPPTVFLEGVLGGGTGAGGDNGRQPGQRQQQHQQPSLPLPLQVRLSVYPLALFIFCEVSHSVVCLFLAATDGRFGWVFWEQEQGSFLSFNRDRYLPNESVVVVVVVV